MQIQKYFIVTTLTPTVGNWLFELIDHWWGNHGQSEPAATNAPVGRSIHWMGCIFSFDIGWVHHRPFPFDVDHYFFFFWFVLCCFFLDLTSFRATLLTFLHL
jgi:hypothetical protein